MKSAAGLGLFLILFSFTSMAADLMPGSSIDINGGAAIMSTSLTGTGFAADTSGTTGLSYGGNLGYAWSKGSCLHFKYSESGAQFSPPATISPSKIKATQSEFTFYGIFQPFEDSGAKNLRFGLGYTQLIYAVDSNSPAIITTQRSQGLDLLVENDFDINDKYNMTAMGLLYLPHQFAESDSHTGFNPKYLGIEGGLRFNWNTREDLKTYLALVYRLDQVSFEGTGNRGVTGGTDTRTTIKILAGVNFEL